MDKVNRLRWIPMMVKAYSDARLRQELQRRGVDWNHAGKPEENGYPSAGTAASVAAELRSTAKQVKKSNSVKQVVKKKGFSQHRPPNLGSVLKEVRETRRHMQELESLKTQLSDMQLQIDQRMTELLQRLNETQGEDMRQQPAPAKPSEQHNPFQ